MSNKIDDICAAMQKQLDDPLCPVVSIGRSEAQAIIDGRKRAKQFKEHLDAMRLETLRSIPSDVREP